MRTMLRGDVSLRQDALLGQVAVWEEWNLFTNDSWLLSSPLSWRRLRHLPACVFKKLNLGCECEDFFRVFLQARYAIGKVKNGK